MRRHELVEKKNASKLNDYEIVLEPQEPTLTFGTRRSGRKTRTVKAETLKEALRIGQEAGWNIVEYRALNEKA